MSFRLKIILGIAATQTVFLLVLIFYLLSVIQQSNEHALLNRAKTTVNLFASMTQAAVLATDLATLESSVTELLTNPGITYARVYSKNQVLAEGGDKQWLNRPFVEDRSLSTSLADGVYDTYADIIISGEKYGRVEIGFSTSNIEQLMSESRNAALVRALISLVLMSVFSWLLGHYLTRGLHALQLGSKKISEGDLGYLINVRGKDELSQAALAFNDMSIKLKLLDETHQTKDVEILKLNFELEQRVIDRTLQLQGVNRQLEHQAMHDSLTSLPNRALFHDHLRLALSTSHRTGDVFALIGIDLDMFKEVNDTLGHHAGDMVLQHVALACNNALRDTDTVARMGGDEFAIILPKVSNTERALEVAHRVLESIKEPLLIDGQQVSVGASLGIAMYPQHGDDELTLTTHSDAAMYEAKRKKSGVVMYQTEMGEGKSEAIALKAELSNAISEGEMVLHFQPKIDFSSHSVTGVEALVRWQHPRLGLVFPDTFIGLAEMSGMIKPLTLEVLRLAMKQILEWRTQGYAFQVAVNISAINLQDKDFPDLVEEMIAEFDIPSHLIELEVTETAVMTEPIIAIENISKLSRMGIQLSIDDFGTGYSSMAYIQKLMVAKIKIDKSFVIDMGSSIKDEIIVRSTIDLAHNLGLKAVAEGVENQESWDKLKELGCDAAQGYFMSKPLSSEKFMEWVLSSHWCENLDESVKKTTKI